VTTKAIRREQPIATRISDKEKQSLISRCKKLAGKKIVIKYGGAALEHEDLKRPTLLDVALLKEAGAIVVLVHGGSRHLSQEMAKRGLDVKMINGLRYTSSETVDMARRVFGQLNTEIVELLDAAGASPIGLKGDESAIIGAKPKDFNRYGYVGDVEEVKVEVLSKLLRQKRLPVISGLGMDSNGQILNINLDTVAAAIAGALSAEKFVLITDVDGILRDVTDSDTRMSLLDREQLKSLQGSNMVANGMLPKVEACLRAMDQGVEETYIISCRQPHALITKLLGETRYGTHIVR
jgi:acetylglutamate kinase